MYWCTEKAIMLCSHKPGKVKDYGATQTWVTIGGNRVLVAPDTVGRVIQNCPMLPPTYPKACNNTIGVSQGYSALIKIGGAQVCMDNLQGPVDAPAPPYTVSSPGQELVGTDT